MSLSEIDEIGSQNISSEELRLLLLSRGNTTKYNRLILTNKCHDEGKFVLPKSFQPYNWQNECVKKWVQGNVVQGHKEFTGIANAVTGTGKTLMSLIAISEFIQSNPNAIVSVVVPSKVLMYQWAEESATYLGLDSESIGFVGDGFSDSFSSDRRLIIWIVNSAVKNNRLVNEINSIVELLATKKIFNKNSSISIKKEYVLDKNEKKLIKNNNFIILTEKEVQLLELFLNSSKPITKKKILLSVWNYSKDADTHTVETHIYRLRKKINDKFFDTSFISNHKDGYYL